MAQVVVDLEQLALMILAGVIREPDPFPTVGQWVMVDMYPFGLAAAIGAPRPTMRIDRTSDAHVMISYVTPVVEVTQSPAGTGREEGR